MLELTAGTESSVSKPEQKPTQEIDSNTLTSALVELAKNGQDQLAKNIMVQLFEKLNEHKNNPDWPQIVKGFYDEVLVQLNSQPKGGL